MKKIFFSFFILFLSCEYINAKEYIFKSYGISKLATIEISKSHKVSSSTYEGLWEDSNGDYGNEKCSGAVKQINKNVDLEIYCETINQRNEIFWNSRVRKSDKGGGVGKMTILNATGTYKKLIGLVCPYGVNYKNEYAWFRAKCKLKK